MRHVPGREPRLDQRRILPLPRSPHLAAFRPKGGGEEDQIDRQEDAPDLPGMARRTPPTACTLHRFPFHACQASQTR